MSPASPVSDVPTLTVADLNALPLDGFERSIGPVYEHSPWVARAAWAERPFADTGALAQALRAVVDTSSLEEREALLRAHPDLAGRELAAGSLTASSSGEQRSVGLDALDPAQRLQLHALARTYRERFGFPCVICVREAGSVEAILAETARRAESTLDEERERAIGEVHKIAWLRLVDLLGEQAAIRAPGRSEVVDLLRAMVGARSENPPGDETAVQDVVRRYLETIPGIEIEVIEAAARRPMIVATLHGDRPGRTLLFGGHIDTVPAGHQWTRDPFAGEVVVDRLYGLGTADMKGGVAGFLVALRRLAGTPFAGTVIAHVVPDEEPGGQLGAMILLERGYLRGDAAVIAEPSELRVFRAQKGNVFASLRTEGRSAHGSMPENGVNAISKAVRLAYDLEERFAPSLAARRHELVGHATVSIGTIHGGARTNVVPDECVLTIDRRVVPGELSADVLAEIERFVDGRADVSYDFVGAAFDTPADHWLVRAAVEVVDDVHGRAMPVGGLVGSSDARFYASDAGIPTIILGPGAMARAHVPDEWVDVHLLESSVEVYERLARSILTEHERRAG